ncbi:MAG: ribonuclease III [Dehalococcoidales bacterium]|nr:ribonuclease III [Dehalococcoidales bacterium]
MYDIKSLQESLKIRLKNPSLLEQALIHSSYLNEYPGAVPASNERLEFFGDAVLDFIVAEKLYRDFPDLDEGEMTRTRSVLVRRETLARVARNLKLGNCLYLGKGEEASGGRQKPANLSSVLEAVIAAIFIDRGLAVTRKLVLGWLAGELQEVMGRKRNVDYKSQLQELIQSKYRSSPSYRTIQDTGPDHDKLFTVEVVIRDRVLGRGTGKSKKLAETEAARSALEQFKSNFTP